MQVVEDIKEDNPYAKIRHDKVILKNLIFMIALWCLTSFTYYLMSNQLKYIKGSIYTNSIASNISEIIANLSSVVVMQKFGYKKTMILFYFVAASGMTALTIY